MGGLMQHWKCHSEFQFCTEVVSTREGGRGWGVERKRGMGRGKEGGGREGDRDPEGMREGEEREKGLSISAE